MSVATFMQEFRESTSPSPLGKIERLWPRTDQPAIGFMVREFDGCVRLSNIRTLDARKGFGSAALKWLTELADRHRATITGDVSPTGTRPVSQGELRKWYRRYGFYVSANGGLIYMPHKPHKGQQGDFATSLGR